MHVCVFASQGGTGKIGKVAVVGQEGGNVGPSAAKAMRPKKSSVAVSVPSASVVPVSARPCMTPGVLRPCNRAATCIAAAAAKPPVGEDHLDGRPSVQAGSRPTARVALGFGEREARCWRSRSVQGEIEADAAARGVVALGADAHLVGVVEEGETVQAQQIVAEDEIRNPRRTLQRWSFRRGPRERVERRRRPPPDVRSHPPAGRKEGGPLVAAGGTTAGAEPPARDWGRSARPRSPAGT